MKRVASILAVAAVATAPCAAQPDPPQEESQNYNTCVKYLESLMESFPGGLEEVRQTAYQQYLDQKSGPYAFCWDGTPFDLSDDVGLMRLVIHPYLEPFTLDELLSEEEDKGQDWAEAKKKFLLENLVQPPRTLFNYSEPFDQPATEAIDVLTDTGDKIEIGTVDQKLVGFIDSNQATGERINCGCRYTGVPAGDRLNENADAAASQQQQQQQQASSAAAVLARASLLIAGLLAAM